MFTVEVNDSKINARLEALPDNVRRSLINRIVLLALLLEGHVKADKLQGQVLHHRSGQLGASIHFDVTSTDTSVSGMVFSDKGSPAYAYAGVHEFGGTFNIPEHTQKRTMVFGHILASPIDVIIRAHKATYPERSFLRSSLVDQKQSIIDGMIEAVREGASQK